MTTANKMIESSEKDCICRTAYFCYLDDSMTAYVVVCGSVSPCLTKVWHYPLVLGAGAFQNCQDPMLGPKGATWIYASICRSLTAPSYRIRPRRMCENQPRMGSGTSLPKSILHLRILLPITLNLSTVLKGSVTCMMEGISYLTAFGLVLFGRRLVHHPSASVSPGGR
jgi:hypothetical protein